VAPVKPTVAGKPSKPSKPSEPIKPSKAPRRGKASAAELAPAEASFPIVAIGASAGGLEAFEEFLRVMPEDSGLGFVLVQHLDPSHASLLVEILQRATRMRVVEATDQMPVLPDRVHVIPPNREMVIAQGQLRLSLPVQARGARMPIDAFMRSLAEDRGERAIGILMSGTGTDGTLGLRAIGGAGGLCMVQDPATAQYDGMPDAAIRAGYATLVQTLDKMPQALLAAAHGQRVMRAAPAASGLSVSASGLATVLAMLRASTGHDFSLYKKSTIGRRIERRMAQHHIEDADAYVRYARERPAELQALFRELLINVTSFFRDAEAFEVLRHKVLPALMAGRTEGSTLRIWVAGCASGEEVYSVAMVVREWMDEAPFEFNVQLYGTDLDDDAIRVARAALYPPNIAQDITPERLRRFFTKDEGGYRVRKEIREMAVFAVQSIIKDPPFTRLDLLCCRNVLIYLEPELQNRLIPTFHYALQPGGMLFLSHSESVSSHSDLFETVDRKWRIYRALPSLASKRSVLGSSLSWLADGGAAAAGALSPGRLTERNVADLAKRVLLQSFAPAAVVTDLLGNIVYVHGDTGPYLRPAPGHPSYNVVDMAREGLQLELREALRVAVAQGSPTTSLATRLTSRGERRLVNLSVRPMLEPGAEHAVLLVSFQEPGEAAVPMPPAPKRRGKLSADALRCQELERELGHAKERMRVLMVEQQASNEELKSTNEELQSTNEELQSTNEELETSKEELQSVNEELVTVNAELQTKVEQTATMHDDMKNLLDNIRVGTVFLDRKLLIRRFTREATQVFRLVASDVGRPLADIRSELKDCDLLSDAQGVLDTLVPTEREARTAGGAWYLARTQPYRTVDNVIDGVVLTFADVTERVRAIASQESRRVAEAIVDAVGSPLLVLDASFMVLSANRSFYGEFGLAPEHTVGLSVFEIAGRRWDVAEVRAMLEGPWRAGSGSLERHAEVGPLAGDSRRYKLDARRVAGKPDDLQVLLLTILPA
jgi:two-component system, chemotaxis family, CheB/CheR fusion protein